MAYAIEDMCEELSGAKDSDAVFSIVREKVSKLGFDRFSYHLVRPPEGPRKPTVMTTYPTAWTERYLDRDYVNVDPVVPTAARRLVPFRWKSLIGGSYRAGFQQQLLDEAGDFGLTNGCTVPLHGPGSCLATLSVTSTAKSIEFDRLWRRYKLDLALVGIYSHEKFVDLNFSPSLPGAFRLAPRERECLLWTSRGKTAWEVSEIIGVSEETVVSYLKSAAKRLDVHGKTHAVAKALMQGLIVP